MYKQLHCKVLSFYSQYGLQLGDSGIIPGLECILLLPSHSTIGFPNPFKSVAFFTLLHRLFFMCISSGCLGEVEKCYNLIHMCQMGRYISREINLWLVKSIQFQPIGRLVSISEAALSIMAFKVNGCSSGLHLYIFTLIFFQENFIFYHVWHNPYTLMLWFWAPYLLSAGYHCSRILNLAFNRLLYCQYE